MDVTALPFNRLLGLEPAPSGSGFLVSLPDGPQYTNHLGTVHASALLAAAEAGSPAARAAGAPAFTPNATPPERDDVDDAPRSGSERHDLGGGGYRGIPRKRPLRSHERARYNTPARAPAPMAGFELSTFRGRCRAPSVRRSA